MRVIQVLPELNSGGVERGTVEFARYLVDSGHESVVISAGGNLVSTLAAEGSKHVTFPVHRKHIASLLKVRALARLLDSIDADIIHVRSRVPAWMVWLAVGRRPRGERPGLVSTFHGLYSINHYSAIMGCGDRVIAISRCVQDYITRNYPKIPPEKISLVHRGVDRSAFPEGFRAPESWRDEFYGQYPHLLGLPIVLMPGRLSRWKGQEQFIELMALLRDQGSQAQGVIVGGPTPGKDDYEKALKQQVSDANLNDRVTFLGHRSDVVNLYAESAVVCNLSQHPEPFGRTVIEALAVGTPVVAFNSGGPAESLADCLPDGLVAPGDLTALANRITQFVQSKPRVALPAQFTLDVQAAKTLAVYEQVLSQN